jgi:hypothetical protein
MKWSSISMVGVLAANNITHWTHMEEMKWLQQFHAWCADCKQSFYWLGSG